MEIMASAAYGTFPAKEVQISERECHPELHPSDLVVGMHVILRGLKKQSEYNGCLACILTIDENGKKCRVATEPARAKLHVGLEHLHRQFPEHLSNPSIKRAPEMLKIPAGSISCKLGLEEAAKAVPDDTLATIRRELLPSPKREQVRESQWTSSWADVAAGNDNGADAGAGAFRAPNTRLSSFTTPVTQATFDEARRKQHEEKIATMRSQRDRMYTIWKAELRSEVARLEAADIEKSQFQCEVARLESELAQMHLDHDSAGALAKRFRNLGRDLSAKMQAFESKQQATGEAFSSAVSATGAAEPSIAYKDQISELRSEVARLEAELAQMHLDQDSAAALAKRFRNLGENLSEKIRAFELKQQATGEDLSSPSLVNCEAKPSVADNHLSSELRSEVARREAAEVEKSQLQCEVARLEDELAQMQLDLDSASGVSRRFRDLGRDLSTKMQAFESKRQATGAATQSDMMSSSSCQQRKHQDLVQPFKTQRKFSYGGA